MNENKVSKNLPKATAKRLPQYYRLFKSLVDENISRTNSQLISASMLQQFDVIFLFLGN